MSYKIEYFDGLSKVMAKYAASLGGTYDVVVAIKCWRDTLPQRDVLQTIKAGIKYELAEGKASAHIRLKCDINDFWGLDGYQFKLAYYDYINSLRASSIALSAAEKWIDNNVWAENKDNEIQFAKSLSSETNKKLSKLSKNNPVYQFAESF
jgi:hypothetical protein